MIWKKIYFVGSWSYVFNTSSGVKLISNKIMKNDKDGNF